MRKTNVLLIVALALAMFAGVGFNQVNTVSAQEVPPVGVVVAYVPGQSITIVDQHGVQHEYLLSSSLKLLPPGRANSLAVGSFVTIIAPNSISNGKQTAVGIVVHPHVPNGWNVPSPSATPFVTDTSIATFTATPTGTLPVTETATATSTAIETTTATATASETLPAAATFTDTPTATVTPPGGTPVVTNDSFIQWLRSLLRQILANS